MKIIIEYGDTKRQIDGAFNICGSKDDLLLLAEKIIAKADKLCYGWIEISETQQHISNTPPVPWEG